ncbi:MAG: cytidyltransferase [Deltaproteobacteria bacterium]|nr:MAG: cytidyltransferase [Deltaproteobacteria bacterium]
MLAREKVISIEEMASIIESLRAHGKKVVHCHGVFDLLHIGHIRYFEQARRMGDVLVVTVTPDRFVDKGPHRPAFPEPLRVEGVASLECVDYAALNQWPTAEETLRLLQPNIYVKGSEFKNTKADLTGKIAREEKVVKEIGATLAFTEDLVFSSTNLINRYLSDYPEEIQQYLNLFRQRYSLQQVLDIIDNMTDLNVIVIGDTIIDEYQYCATIGISSKDPAIAVKYQSHDTFAGGVLAVANHVSNFVNRVYLVTVLGERDSYEDFIKSQLNHNIYPYYIYDQNASTIVKRRFVEGYSLIKLFEVYVMDGGSLSPEQEGEICNWLKKQLPQTDLAIAADFGHGAISKPIRNTLIRRAPFLAINTQANAGNRGFHTVSRYSHADFACIAEHEIRLETRDVNGKLRPMMEFLAQKLDCSQFIVTRGKKGCYIRGSSGDFVAVPSFGLRIVDRVGAGDAFLSMTALAAALKAPTEILGFLGNVMGALAVGVMGNRKSIDKQSVKNFIVSLLKEDRQ